jgi:hypothetical protein
MILNNTKTNGYSLGLPLWLSGDSPIPSTGILQGITMTLQGNYTEVYLSKYSRQDNEVSMTFSTEDAILCSVDATLSGEPQTFALNGETVASSKVRFISGAVTLYDVGGSLEVDLTGAQVCPKYLQFIPAPATDGAMLEIINAAPGGAVVTSAPWATVTPETSVDVEITSVNSGTYIASAIAPSPVEVIASDTSLISYINGSQVSGGSITINLGSGWIVGGGGVCAKVGTLTDSSSCPDANYIEAKLNPGNYTHSCPLDLAFSGGILTMSKVYSHDFNTEYENGGSGLAWCEFSSQHDIFSSGGVCVKQS